MWSVCSVGTSTTCRGRFQFLEGDRAKAAFLIPGEADEIVEAASEPIPDAIFGDASDAGTMVDGNFKRAGAGSVDQDGEETMEAVKGEDALECSALKGTRGATGVREVYAQRRSASPAGDLGGGAPDEAIVALDPFAAHEIHPGQFADQPWQIGRVIL